MTTTVLAPLPKERFVDSAGLPLVGGKLFTYAAGTTAKQVTYTDATGTVPNTNPVVLDARGEANVWLDASLAYKFVLSPSTDTDPPTAAIWTVDNVAPANSIVPTSLTAFIAQLLTSVGASLIGWIQAGGGAVLRLLQDKVRESVSVKDYGAGTELGALIQAAVNAGATNILVPTASNWTWTTVVTLPALWRGRIFSENGYGTSGSVITAKTGHTNPCIDAQGALFVEIEGLHVLADDSANTAPACFIVIARMPTGASSGNHRLSRNVIEGQFYYCCLYNVGGEELVFENNYWAMYGTAQAVSPKIACIVHQLSEDAFYSGITSKAARTNGTSTSAIVHRNDVVKNQNPSGCSAMYVGPNVNDIDFDIDYGTTSTASYFLYLAGYFDGIRLGVGRVECDKTCPIVAAPTDVTAGTISLYKGAYRRSGVVDPTHYAIDIGGTTASGVTVYVSPDVSWTSTFGGQVEDIYLLRSTRKTICDVSFRCGAPEETLSNTKINIATLLASQISMGLQANLTVTTYLYGNCITYYYNPVSTLQAFDIRGGAAFRGRPVSFYGTVGGYQATDFNLDTVGNGIQAYFLNPNGVVGSISSNGSVTNFNTSSDKDWKIDKGILTGPQARDAVVAWSIHSYSWKSNGVDDVGVFAQELKLVKPNAVTGTEGDVYTDTDGTEVPIPMSVDYTKLIPELIRLVQWQEERITALEAK